MVVLHANVQTHPALLAVEKFTLGANSANPAVITMVYILLDTIIIIKYTNTAVILSKLLFASFAGSRMFLLELTMETLNFCHLMSCK
jgi:hypothetical protein